MTRIYLAYLAYLIFALAHPISELIKGFDLRTFLNLDYYRTGREDFPVSRKNGVRGSLFVLVILVLPLLGLLLRFLFPSLPSFVVDLLWSFAIGLTVADVFQHGFHFASRPKAAPLLHLLTILGVFIPLWWIFPVTKLFNAWNIGALIIGVLLIAVNWWKNSSSVHKETATPKSGLSLQP